MAENKSEQKSANKKRYVKKRYVYGADPIPYSQPTLARAVTLNTVPAQIAYEGKFYLFASRARSVAEYVPIAVRHKEDVAFVNGLVDKMVGGVQDGIRLETARIKKIAEDNGIGVERLTYSNPINYSAEITSGRAGVYLQAIRELDELICLVHAAWFAGFVSGDEKAALEEKWRLQLERVAHTTKDIAERAFIPALIAAFCAEYRLSGDVAKALKASKPVKAIEAAKELPAEAGEPANRAPDQDGDGAAAVAAKPKRAKQAAATAAEAVQQPVEEVAAL